MAVVLVVDDRYPNRAFLVAVLRSAGHQSLQAADGAEALERLRADRPDLVITDVLMPVLDGYELVRQIRADPAIADTPVIFYTAHYQDAEAQALAATAHVAQVLTKPAPVDQLLTAIDAALARRTPVPPAPTDSFDRAHLRLLTNKLASKVDELQFVNRRLATLLELGQHLAQERDPLRLLQTYCDAARAVMGAPYAALGLLNDAGATIQHLFSSGIDHASTVAMAALPLYQELLNRLLIERRALRLPNLHADPRMDAQPAAYPAIQAFLGVPIASPSQVYGWLCLGKEPDAPPFSADDEQFALTLGAQIGVAYENAHRAADLQHHAAALEAEIAERRRAEAAQRQSEQRFAVAFQSSPLAICISTAERGRFVDVNEQFLALTGYARDAVIGRTDMELNLWIDPDERARMAMLLRERSAARGIETQVRTRTGAIHEVRLAIESIELGEQRCVLALIEDITGRKRAEEQLRAHSVRTSLLAELSYLLTDLDLAVADGLAVVTQRVANLMGDACVIRLLSDDGQRLLPGASYHSDPVAHQALQAMLAAPQRSDEGLGGQVVHTGQPLLIASVPPEKLRALIPPAYWPYIERFGVHSTMIVPLRARGRVIGTLALVRDRSHARYTPADQVFAQDLADRVALALHNTQLYHQTQAALRHTDEALALLDTLLGSAPVGLAFWDRDRRCVRINDHLAAINGLPVAAHLGRALQEILPALAPTLEPLLERVLRTGAPLLDQEISGETPASPGARRHWLASYYPVRTQQGAILGVGTVVTEITERKRAEQRQAMRFALSRLLAESPTRQAAITPLLQLIGETEGWEVGMLWRSDPDAGALRWEAAWHLPDDLLAAFGARCQVSNVAPGAGLPGRVWSSAQPAWIDDLGAGSDDALDRAAREAGLRSAFAVPIRGSSGVLGVLECLSRHSRQEDTALLLLLSDMGRQIGQFFERMQAEAHLRASHAQLQALSRRLVELQEAERRHIARELHDEIGQALTGLKLTLELSTQMPPEALQAQLRDALALVSDLTRRVRDLSLDLRPSMLDDLGLLPALLWHLERYTAQTRILVDFRHRGLERRFAPEVETAAYRIVQEALTNVARYAGVPQAAVRVWADEAILSVQIEEQGRGFAVEALASGASSGLSGMRERAALLGGRFTIDTAPGHGARLTAELPLDVTAPDSARSDGHGDDRADR